jgi:hypothetical protein
MISLIGIEIIYFKNESYAIIMMPTNRLVLWIPVSTRRWSARLQIRPVSGRVKSGIEGTPTTTGINFQSIISLETLSDFCSNRSFRLFEKPI